ncbi:flagellin, partial [Rhodobacteraceae bacterium]|nr:flagellin [Paracoccaceae bacterium]
VNGDGLADLIVGASRDDPNGTYSGASTVVFGKADGTAVELSDIESSSNSGGFVINGDSEGDYSGYSVRGAGDVNGDGLDDLIVGAWGDDPNGWNSGASTVVFGKADGTAIELSDIESSSNSGGFVINGASFGDISGWSVSGAGDVNGDGLDDLIVGAYNDDPNGVNSGSSTVVFGKADGTAVELSDIEAGTGTEAALASDVSFGVGGKTLTLDLSPHHDGSNNDYYAAAEAIASTINNDSDLQALDYSAVAATVAEVSAGTYAAGDIIITRADTPATTITTLVGNAASFVVEGITVNTDLSAYSANLSGAAAAVASDINTNTDLQALDYSAVADGGTPGDIIISRADTATTSSTTLAGNSVSVVIEGVTVTTDVTAYTSDISGAASAVAAAINAEGSLQSLDYNATVDTSNPGDIVISRANTPITQAYVAAVPASTAMSLTSGDSARTATAKIDTAINAVNIQRSKLGAVSNRLSHTVNNLTNISSNLSAARGGIEDADFAKETTDLAKNQILQQASTAMLAQANASKQNVLSLLQG